MWLKVGMELKEEGHYVSVWYNWSQKDSRYNAGECQRKWDSFTGHFKPVTDATIIQLAMERGMTFGNGGGRALNWDDEINFEFREKKYLTGFVMLNGGFMI